MYFFVYFFATLSKYGTFGKDYSKRGFYERLGDNESYKGRMMFLLMFLGIASPSKDETELLLNTSLKNKISTFQIPVMN